jgi:MFS family permease
LRALANDLPWPSIMLGVAALAAASGVLILALGEAPQAAVRVTRLQWQALGTLWTDTRVRSSALGYFGHMWELYTLWVLAPMILATRLEGVALSWAAFVLVASGAVGCTVGGHAVRRWGSARVAGLQLAASGLCCLLAPWLIEAPATVFYGWLLLWGITVAGDSPQFSALTARNAPPQAVGSVLTLTNSIGFAISIVSILLFVSLSAQLPLGWLLTGLALGPAMGLWAMWPLMRERA